MKDLIKSILFLLIVFIIVKFSYTYFPSEKFQQFKTESTDLSQETLGEYELGHRLDSSRLATNQFDRAADGKNMKYAYDGGNKKFNYIRIKDGLIGVSKAKDGIDEILGYIVFRNDISTSRGLGLGSSQDDIIRAYGEDYYCVRKISDEFIGYIDKENKLTLRFFIEDQRVIRFDLNYIEANKALNL